MESRASTVNAIWFIQCHYLVCKHNIGLYSKVLASLLEVMEKTITILSYSVIVYNGTIWIRGHTVVQFAETLHYKLEGCRFDS
jgi:hypothetical protein